MTGKWRELGSEFFFFVHKERPYLVGDGSQISRGQIPKSKNDSF